MHIPYPEAQASEFEIQAELFTSLRDWGYDVRGEVRCSEGKLSFDLVVFHDKRAIRIIETKKSGCKQTREEEQVRKYAKCGLPIDVIRGRKAYLTYIEHLIKNPSFMRSNESFIYEKQSKSLAYLSDI